MPKAFLVFPKTAIDTEDLTSCHFHMLRCNPLMFSVLKWHCAQDFLLSLIEPKFMVFFANLKL